MLATCSAIPWDWVSATGKDIIEFPSLCEMKTPLDVDAEEDPALGEAARNISYKLLVRDIELQ
jgi:hypothetical protein